MATLLVRLFYLQVVTGESYREAAQSNTVREVATPAVRGLILDQAGRPLVANRTSLVVTVDRVMLQREDDDGAAVITRLAQILDVPAASISDRPVVPKVPSRLRFAGTVPRISPSQLLAMSMPKLRYRSWKVGLISLG
jgi:cell division protein FtsI/penicillin-binding protein 2